MARTYRHPLKEALVGCLIGEPKEFAKTLAMDLLMAEDSGLKVLKHLDKAYMDSDKNGPRLQGFQLFRVSTTAYHVKSNVRCRILRKA
jgi:hypothetical protein